MFDISEAVLPHWLRDLPTGRETTRKRTRFLLRLAALYATEEGTLSALSTSCGRPEANLRTMAHHPSTHKIQPELARTLEKVSRSALITREILAPEVFGA